VDEVAEFAAEYFYNSSPLRELALSDDPTDEVGFFAWRKGRLQKCFANPTSVIVRENSTGKLIAFVAIEIEEKKGFDMYDLYGTNRILHLWFAAVRNDYRNQQIFAKKEDN